MKRTVTQRRRSKSTPKHYDWLIVGAGFAGCVLAEQIATHRKESVLIIDRRDHIGGNAYDHVNDAGILVHKYGPHIFHTNCADIFGYLSQFTTWRSYTHRVLASVDGQLVPIPINRTTLNRLYGLKLETDAEVAAFFADRADPVSTIRTSEDAVVSKVGRELYEKFFRGYTRKQWGLDPSQLDASVTSRIPTRTDTDDRYFNDTYQFMPENGYTKMFERMLSNRTIDVQVDVDFDEVRKTVTYDKLIYTGQIDEYFDFRYGPLPYRSLRFEHQTLDKSCHQPVGVVNYPQDKAYTRITEYKYLTGQKHSKTAISYEYSSASGDPYYPIPRPENQALFKKYQRLADDLHDVWFVGRLATYRYYNMDQVVGQALATFRKIMLSTPKETVGPVSIVKAESDAAL